MKQSSLMKTDLFSSPAAIRRFIQLCFTVFYVYVGIRFYFYYLWVTGVSDTYISKPASVEAFLPLSAMMGAKVWLVDGIYDPIHPAGLTIFILAILTAVIFRKGFCGYFCPSGYLSGLLHRLGQRFGIARQLNSKVGKPLNVLLTLPKYLLLGLFIKLIWWDMSSLEMQSFMQGTYNQVADSKMLLFFLHPGTISLVVMFTLLVGSLIVPNLWCRGFCPYGALLGIFSKFSPVAISRDKDKCIDCKLCSQACPSRLEVHKTQRVLSAECQGCTECVSVCPKTDCLRVKAGSATLPSWSIAAGSLFLLLLLYFSAIASGNWNNTTPPEMQRAMHKEILNLQHP